MFNFENTFKETIQEQTAKEILGYLHEHLLYPANNLSYAEQMETSLEFDLTIGDWLVLYKNYTRNRE